MSITAYLQQYLNSISKLPSEIKKSLDEVAKIEDLMIYNDGSMTVNELVKKIQNSSTDEIDFESLEQLKQKLTENLSHSTKKIEIVNKLYTIVDQEVNRLDADLKKLENEISAKNSQQKLTTETTDVLSASNPIRNMLLNPSYCKIKDSSNQHTSSASLLSNMDMAIDPNEPTYCICHQVSYGNMVMCDNSKCPYEWFHFGCVGLVDQPRGKWYCPKCRRSKKSSSKRRKY